MRYSREDAVAALEPHWPHTDGGEIDMRACWPSLDVGDGWADVIVFAVMIGEAVNPDFVVNQVKEKFGGLRFYCTLPLVTELMIEGLALHVCETCGELGSLSYSDGPGPWLKTLCKDHLGTDYGQYLTREEWKAKYEPGDDC